MNRLKETILILTGNQPISGIYGKYINKDNIDTPNIELKNDGTSCLMIHEFGIVK